MDTKNIGLRDIEVADTKISNVDGDRGRLIYRGYDVFDLVKNSNFEETCYLLLYNKLPTTNELENFNEKLIISREIPQQMQKNMKNWRRDADPMDVLQAFVAALAGYYDEEFPDKNSSYEKAINLIAKIPTIISCWERIRNHNEIIYPDPHLDHASNFLYMLNGKKPDDDVSKIFDVCLILHADHSFNASTFTARQVASTRAHMYSATSAAIGALSGELHGGANYEVMKMLLDIKDEKNVETWINKKLNNGEKIMGMGHAVYRTYDPRALILQELSKTLAKKTTCPWFNITKKIEIITREKMKKDKKIDIYPNVDLYSASIYYMLNIPMDLNTPIFAISRIAGWTAHIIEERYAEAAPKPALYRPKAVYIGKYCGPHGCKYKKLELRSN